MYKIFSSLLGTEKKEKEKKTNKNSIKIHSESNNNEDLNEECKTKINEIILTDKEIDKGLDAIDNALDNCMKMAKDMKEEMLSQNNDHMRPRELRSRHRCSPQAAATKYHHPM